MIEITWIDAAGRVHVEQFERLEDARRAIADLRGNGKVAWISKR